MKLCAAGTSGDVGNGEKGLFCFCTACQCETIPFLTTFVSACKSTSSLEYDYDYAYGPQHDYFNHRYNKKY